jgi:predicted ATPase
MALSNEMRLLQNKWNTRSGWPKFLEWIEIEGVRGWIGQRIDFPFPIVAIVGENGSGKSTIIQAVASAYQSPNKKLSKFASDFFPDTSWDTIRNASIRFGYKEGIKSSNGIIRKPTDRWRRNPNRPLRYVNYIDLGRIQPVSARTGYKRLANPQWKVTDSKEMGESILQRLSDIIGKGYKSASMALTSGDAKRRISVIGKGGIEYSGFHQGAGEITIMEFLEFDPIQYSIVLVDEIETSLHPRAQRRLIRDLAKKCHQLELQIILTTHSPYILEELPLEGRLYIIDGQEKKIARGVSPEFAMAKMDDEPHAECDIYVEDNRSAIFIREILYQYKPEDVARCQFICYGAASVGIALGQMIEGKKFQRPSCVYLDGDQVVKPGCNLLPGNDAPERIVFDQLNNIEWKDVAARIARSYSDISDYCRKAMNYADHHEWIRYAADQLMIGGDSLWEALCSCWAKNCLDQEIALKTILPIESLIGTIKTSSTLQGRLF